MDNAHLAKIVRCIIQKRKIKASTLNVTLLQLSGSIWYILWQKLLIKSENSFEVLMILVFLKLLFSKKKFLQYSRALKNVTKFYNIRKISWNCYWNVTSSLLFSYLPALVLALLSSRVFIVLYYTSKLFFIKNSM